MKRENQTVWTTNEGRQLMHNCGNAQWHIDICVVDLAELRELADAIQDAINGGHQAEEAS